MQPAPITTSRDMPAAAIAAAPAPLPEEPGASQATTPGAPAGVGRHPVITFPVLGTFYPQRALRAKKEGDVTATCAVTLAGGLTQCAINSETPGGYGFGDATLKALARTHVQVVFRHGVQTPQALRIPISWRLPQPASTAEPPPPQPPPPQPRR